MYMEQLAHKGVNIQYVHESELPTASFNVITDADQNQVNPSKRKLTAALAAELKADANAIKVTLGCP